MAENGSNGSDARQRLLGVLLDKVAQDTYPSTTMLDYIEEILEPGDVDAYAAVLLEKIADETYPSVTMLRRLINVTVPQ